MEFIAWAYRPDADHGPNTLTGIALIGAGGANVANYRFNNLAFSNINGPINILRPGWGTIENSYFDTWGTAAGITCTTTTGVEGACGQIAHNYFFGQQNYTNPAIYSEVGYTIIDANEVLGGNNGIQFNIKNYPAGFVNIVNNTVENFGAYGVQLGSGDCNSASMWKVVNNEFSVNANATQTASVVTLQNLSCLTWLNDLDVSLNVSRNTSIAMSKHFWIQAGVNVRVTGNEVDELGNVNSVTAYQMTGATNNGGIGAPFLVADNTVLNTGGATITRYSLPSTAVVTVRDQVGDVLANLPAFAANGSEFFVTNGTASAWHGAITSGGTGQPAIMVASSWVAK